MVVCEGKRPAERKLKKNSLLYISLIFSVNILNMCLKMLLIEIVFKCIAFLL